jgi:ABC-type dipeptide/oligopeptide/nickel transport system permease component
MLDQPLYVQYFRWMGLIMQGNTVWHRMEPAVLDVIGDRPS